MNLIERLQAQLAEGRDSALLRLSLAQALLGEQRNEDALLHLRQALNQDPDYTAAWKALGEALRRSDDPAAAAEAWNQGIEVATRRGDVQARREMEVFLRRLPR